MAESQRAIHAWQKLGLLGEDPALQFVNTVDDTGKSRLESGVPDWPTLLAWAGAAAVVTEAEVAALQPATGTPGADAEVKAVHELREASWRLLRAHAAGEQDADAATKVTAAARWAFARAELRRGGASFDWTAAMSPTDLTLVRVRLALLVERFLRSSELARLRECGRCAALFLDHGRGRGRKWCRMSTCGNRAKADRFRGQS
jgi:predicted RNA-binding Zn ribbon-like protein